jgi:Fe/S biogenesis protein NfuA
VGREACGRSRPAVLLYAVLSSLDRGDRFRSPACRENVSLSFACRKLPDEAPGQRVRIRKSESENRKKRKRENRNMTDAILNVTEAASQRLASVRAEQRDGGAGLAVRLQVVEDGTVFRYGFQFVPQGHQLEGDAVVDADGLLLYVDAESIPRVSGGTLEFLDDAGGMGFRFQNPNKTRLSDDPLAQRIQEVIESHVNPGLSDHGGWVSLVEIQDSRVYVRLNGGCQGCGQASVTVNDSITTTLKQMIPEITEVLDATDHSGGANPYC